MNLHCQKCGQSVRLSAENAVKFAGRRIKCPKCSEPLTVPGSAPAKPPTAAALPAKPPVASAAAAKPPVAGPSTAKPPAAAKPPVAADTAALPNFDTPAAGGGVDLGATGRQMRSPLARVQKPNKPAIPLPWLLGGGGAIAVVLMLAVLLAVVFSGSGSPVADALDLTGRSNLRVNGKGELTLVWPEAERRDAQIRVDGETMELPSTGPVSYLIPAGQHQVVIVRRGYEQVETQIVVPEKDAVSFTPTWRQLIAAGVDRFGPGAAQGGYNPNANYDNWLQDFDQAKVAAAVNHKDILVLFNGSDWCPYCIQLAREVLFDNRFEPIVGGEYVLVNVDFPRTRASQAKVENMPRNELLSQQFAVEGYPTMVLTDAQGLPYAKLGYSEGGFANFQTELEEAQSIRQVRDDLIRLVESESWGQRQALATRFFGMMYERDLASFYSNKFQHWFDTASQADPQNRLGYNEHFFEFIWMARIADNKLLENESGLRTVVDELDRWKGLCKFRDGERAARMHLTAAIVMYELGDADAVTRFAAAGAAYATSDSRIAEALEYLVSAGDSINVAGNGTGWVVAGGGYVMTNHHVIEGDGRVAVRLPDVEEPVPCRVVAQHEENDLALLKIDHPAMADLEPLQITLVQAELAQEIAVLGYPLSDTLGNQVKFTSGEIASTGGTRGNDMLLLDCTVNPGNSGGPLCNTAGQVVGIVTAKSIARSGVEDTYGMAVPAEKIVTFLKQHLPSYEPPAAPSAGEANALPPKNWSAAVRQIKGSVIQVVILRR